jgi:hypothetical protein
MYKEIDKLLGTVTDVAEQKYTPIYNEIKGYKEISLKPYRKAIEEEERIKKEDAENLLKEYLAELNTYNIYESSLEQLFTKIEKQMDYCEELGVDISDYYADYVSEKDFILRTKPQPEIPVVKPPVSEEDENIEEETSNEEEDEEIEEIEESHIVDEHYSGNVYVNYGKNQGSKLTVSN